MTDFPEFHGDTPLYHSSKKEKGCTCKATCNCANCCDCECATCEKNACTPGDCKCKENGCGCNCSCGN